MKTSLGQKITICPHAGQRIKERLLNDLIQEAVVEAFENGEELSEE